MLLIKEQALIEAAICALTLLLLRLLCAREAVYIAQTYVYLSLSVVNGADLGLHAFVHLTDLLNHQLELTNTFICLLVDTLKFFDAIFNLFLTRKCFKFFVDRLDV